MNNSSSLIMGLTIPIAVDNLPLKLNFTRHISPLGFVRSELYQRRKVEEENQA